MQIENISIEKIKQLKLLPIHKDEKSLKPLKLNLDLIVRFKNMFKSKYRIVFNTTEGEKTIYTKIWNKSNHYLELEGGIILLISAIASIKLVWQEN